MSPNHRLLTQDVVRLGDTKVPAPEIVGTYLRCPLTTGDTLDTSDLQPVPTFTLSDGHAPYLISIQNQPAVQQVLDVGSRVDVWRGLNPMVFNVPVLAIVCRNRADSLCVVAIDAGRSDREVLGRNETGATLLLVRQIKP